MNLLEEIRGQFREALAGLVDDPAELLDMVRPSQNPKFGDYQANCAMPLGKRLGRPPREVAGEIVARLDVSSMCHPPEIAGAGFINLRLQDAWLTEQLLAIADEDRLGVPAVEPARTYVLDYSSPNVAKPMHVGHIRSTVIGDALARTLRFLGHRVITDNHLGDWGTQFGMIIYGWKHFRDEAAFQQAPVAELARLYRLVNQLVEYHAAVAKLPLREQAVRDQQQAVETERETLDALPASERKRAKKALRRQTERLDAARAELASDQSRIQTVTEDPRLSALAADHAEIGTAVLQETARLHAYDQENLALWNRFLPLCRDEIGKVYARLEVGFDHEHGESFYQEWLGDVVQDFRQRDLARESDGAMCLFLDGFETPMLIQKRDGAFLYATTDLATIRYRMETWDPDAILYVVDHRQSEHFEKLFAAARLWGYGDVELQHVSFGTVTDESGKPYKTRSGDTVGLEQLLDEAVGKAYRVVSDNDDGKPGGAELDESQRRRIADVVGHAAIKYADLSQNRTSDYVFSFDKMMALEGNTATYMQYSYARTQNIFARGGVQIEQLRAARPPILLDHPMERGLALMLLRLPEALRESMGDYRPNILTAYLFDLAKRFSEFYQQCPVLKADTPAQRDSRLMLCDLTGRVIRLGLELLGIQVVDKM
jgi:arginyl-tRNA synthetase